MAGRWTRNFKLTVPSQKKVGCYQPQWYQFFKKLERLKIIRLENKINKGVKNSEVLAIPISQAVCKWVIIIHCD